MQFDLYKFSYTSYIPLHSYLYLYWHFKKNINEHVELKINETKIMINILIFNPLINSSSYIYLNAENIFIIIILIFCMTDKLFTGPSALICARTPNMYSYKILEERAKEVGVSDQTQK